MDQKRWGPGTQLSAESTEACVLLRATPVFAPALAADVFACLGHPGPPKTLEEMDAGVLAEAKRRHARNRH